MNSSLETADAIGRRFHGPTAHTVQARVRPAKHPILVSHVVSDVPSPERTLPPPPEAAYAIHLHHKPLLRGETWIDGRHAMMPAIAVGSICIFDLEGAPIAVVRDSLDFTRFGISQATLDDLAYDRGQTGARRLAIPELGHPDRVIAHLALAMIHRASVFGHETDSLFADWIGLAFHAHLVDTYSEARPARAVRLRLAPWRLREACDWMMARLGGALSIAEVAAEVGMTPGYFARAFRDATGEPPHQWLLRKRIARAKELLRLHDLSLAEVAAACGFADQSHLTRVFGRVEGITPGRWRQRMRS